MMRVLVVDDEPTSRRMLARALEHFGYSVIECRDGVEAFQVLEETGPAVLVLDYNLPEFTGAQICEIIRTDPNPDIAQVPIIFVTAYSGTEREVECLKAGGDDFVSRPVNFAVLKARIETHLRVYSLREELQRQKSELEKWRHNHEQDLDAARLTQQAILPQRIPQVPGWELAAHFHPLIQVGGDIYNWLRMPGGELMIWIADATGHGASAALITTLAQSLFRNGVGEFSSPGLVLRSVNENFRGVFKGRSFMTAACLVLRPDSPEITFSGAGHPPLLIVRQSGKIEQVAASCPPIGLDAVTEPVDEALQLEAGDTLLLCTDGLYAATNPAGERLTQAQWIQRIRPRSSVRQFIDGVMKNVADYAEGCPFPDDIAAVAAMRLAGAASGSNR